MQDLYNEGYDTGFKIGYDTGFESGKASSNLKPNFSNPIQTDIDEIMDWFDFEKVHRVMVSLNWKWVSFGGPSIQEIRVFARKLLYTAVSETIDNGCEDYDTGSGGFNVQINTDKETGKLYIKLTFQITDWSNWG